MKYSLLANAALRPYLEHLILESANTFDITYLSGDTPHYKLIQEKLENNVDCDAVIVLEGANAIPFEGLTTGDTRMIIPRVHNLIALLLGSAAEYRRLFDVQKGNLCWLLPVSGHEICFTPREDCTCLCYVAEMELPMYDASLNARAVARYNNWDYLSTEGDLSLLRRLLSGKFDCDDILVVPPRTMITLDYTRALFSF